MTFSCPPWASLGTDLILLKLSVLVLNLGGNYVSDPRRINFVFPQLIH